MALWDIFKKDVPPSAPGVVWPHPSTWPEGPVVFQIFYSEDTRARLDPRFLPIDNSANGRPDWREYHAMRSLLLHTPLDEERFYGFFSPKFGQKTRLDGAMVHAFLAEHPEADVALFSPFHDLQAFFPNTIVQGDYFHPGLLTLAEAFFDEIGVDIDVRNLVTDSRRSVFCNYFVAKPPFWREWLGVAEKLYRACESRSGIGRLLTRETQHRADEHVQFKVFILERIADVLMAAQPRWRVISHPQGTLSPVSTFNENPPLAAHCDLLKARFVDSGDPAALREFFAVIRSRGIETTWQPELPADAQPL